MNAPPKERRGLQAALRTHNTPAYATRRDNATREVRPHCLVCGLVFCSGCLACIARISSGKRSGVIPAESCQLPEARGGLNE